MTGRGPRYARKPDGNQAELSRQLADIPGLIDLDVSHLPGLGCDRIVFYRGDVRFVEIKVNDKEELTASEKRLRDMAGPLWVRVVTVEDVLAAFGAVEPAAIY